MTLVLYQHPFASYCQKVLIALYELDLPFDSHLVAGDEGRAELARLWPMAGIPVLRDEDADLTLPESTTIIEYLDGLAGDGPALIPPDAGEVVVEHRVDAVERRARLGDAVRVGGAVRPQRVADDLLHRRHEVPVDQPVPEPRLQRRRERRRVAVAVEVLDDRGRLGQRQAGRVVDEDRDARHGPELGERGAIRRVADEVALERDVPLVQRDERLPAVGGERVLVQDQRHARTVADS